MSARRRREENLPPPSLPQIRNRLIACHVTFLCGFGGGAAKRRRVRNKHRLPKSCLPWRSGQGRLRKSASLITDYCSLITALLLPRQQLDLLPWLEIGFFRQYAAQLVNLVAQNSRFLELQVPGGIFHLLLHFGNHAL